MPAKPGDKVKFIAISEEAQKLGVMENSIEQIKAIEGVRYFDVSVNGKHYDVVLEA